MGAERRPAARPAGTEGKNPFAGRFGGSGWLFEIAEDGSVGGFAPYVLGKPRDALRGYVTRTGKMDLSVPVRQRFTDELGKVREITLAQSLTLHARVDDDGDLVVASGHTGTFLAYRL